MFFEIAAHETQVGGGDPHGHAATGQDNFRCTQVFLRTAFLRSSRMGCGAGANIERQWNRLSSCSASPLLSAFDSHRQRRQTHSSLAVFQRIMCPAVYFGGKARRTRRGVSEPFRVLTRRAGPASVRKRQPRTITNLFANEGKMSEVIWERNYRMYCIEHTSGPLYYNQHLSWRPVMFCLCRKFSRCRNRQSTGSPNPLSDTIQIDPTFSHSSVKKTMGLNPSPGG